MPGIYCLLMRAFSQISGKMGYSRNLPCNDYVEISLHHIFVHTNETAYAYTTTDSSSGIESTSENTFVWSPTSYGKLW